MMDLKLFGSGLITLPRLVGSNKCFFKIITDVFPCDNTHLNAPVQQTAKSSAFIEVITLADDSRTFG